MRNASEHPLSPDNPYEPSDTLLRPRGDAGTLLFVVPEESAQNPIQLFPEPQSRIGMRVGGFRVLRELGSGGMGTVYLAEHELIGRRAAVKILHRHLAPDRSLVQRFFAEARAVNLIAHDNVVNVFDLCLSPQHEYCLVMEYLEGRPLSDLTAEPMDLKVALPILMQICDGLDAAHRHGIVHRDLKPANIFLIRKGDDENFVKLLDFGIAKLLQQEAGAGKTAVGMVIGTPEFMAPEQCSSDAQIDARTDLYAVGVLMYLMATGKLPFTGNSPPEVLVAHLQRDATPAHQAHRGVSQAWSKLIARAMARHPDDRFQTARDLKAALRELEQTNAQQPSNRPTQPGVQAAFAARLVSANGKQVRVQCRDVSASGAYVCCETELPPLMSDVALVIDLPGGELACTARVVFQVVKDQAAKWKLPPGFGVQITDRSPAFRDAFAKLLRGERLDPQVPPSAVHADCASAEPAIAEFRRRLNGNHYSVLAVSEDAEFDQIRIAARDSRARLEGLLKERLSPKQRGWVETAIQRVSQAFHVLGNAQRRIDFDGSIRNFRGVARCLASGLTVTELEAARRRFLAELRVKETAAPVHFIAGQSYEQAGEPGKALHEYERALQHDPLNLTYQQKYWKLKAQARWAK